MAVGDPLSGQFIGGYRIVELVGRGGMGRVYRARDEELRRDIALKLLQLDLIGEERDAERFRREARLAAALNHPNIVAIYGTGREAGYLYLAMELVEGTSLRALIRERRGPHPVETALGIVAQLLEALRVSHQHAIVHRDIKPENILVKADGTIKVLDFGIAKLEGGTVLTRADELLGTVEYMAPEQILGDAVGPAADLYAAGVVLYELVTGRKPFPGESAATLVYHQLNEEPAAPSLLNPSAPRALDRFALRLLDKLPENRFGSAGAALEALRKVQRRQQLTGVPHQIDREEPGEEEKEEEEEEEFQARDPLFRFTGRQNELDRLKSHFGEAAREGKLVFVAGEAGIGKSRLVEELARHIEGTDEGRVIKGICFFEHGMGPYMPFLDAIGNLFSKEQNGLGQTEREALGRLLGQQAPELAELATRPSTTAKIRASFAAVFGRDKDPEAGRQRFFDAVFELLAAAAAEKPLVVALEDMHWADEGSLQLLQSLVRRAPEARILWLATYRPEELGEAGDLAALLRQFHAENLLHEIRLERLGKESLERLVRSLFRAADFTQEFGDFLYEQSQGNPLIAGEVVRLLRSRDILFCDSGVWTVRSDLATAAVPARVEALIGQRLDPLDEEQRELLQVAAVIGQRFTSEVLGAVANLPRIALLKALFRLEKRHQLITSANGLYEFGHSKIREVLYAEIPWELRREYHGIIAGALEALRAQGREVEDEALGRHLYEAGEYRRAFPYLLRMGDEAFRFFGWRRAAELFDRAVEAGQQTGADPADLILALRRSSMAYGYLTAYDQALDRCEQLRRLAAESNRPAELAKAWSLTGEWCKEQRHFAEAVTAFEQALDSLDGEGESELRARILQSWGCVDFESGQYGQAEARWRKSLEILQEQAPQETASVLNNLAVLETMRSNLDAAWALYARVLALDAANERVPEKAGESAPERMVTLWNMGMLRADQERWDEALELYDRSLEICRQTRYLYHQPTVELNRVEALLGKGDLAEARRVCGRVLRGFRRLDDALGLADTMRLYGRLCRLEENWEESREYLERSIEMNRPFGESLSLGEALYEKGLVQREQGETAGAVDSLWEAERIFAQIEAADLERVRMLLAELEPA